MNINDLVNWKNSKEEEIQGTIFKINLKTYRIENNENHRFLRNIYLFICKCN